MGTDFKCGSLPFGKDWRRWGVSLVQMPRGLRLASPAGIRAQSTVWRSLRPLQGKAVRSKLSLEQKLKILFPLQCVDFCTDGAKALVDEAAGSSAPAGRSSCPGCCWGLGAKCTTKRSPAPFRTFCDFMKTSTLEHTPSHTGRTHTALLHTEWPYWRTYSCGLSCELNWPLSPKNVIFFLLEIKTE